LIFFNKHIYKIILVLSLLFFGGGYFIFRPSSYYFLIPVHSDAEYWGGIPLFQIEVGSKSFQVELDLGTELSALNREELDFLDKKFYGTFPHWDMHGNFYENPIYEISQIKVHDFLLSEMKIREESSEFLKNSVLSGNSDKITSSGRMGRDIFENKNFLLDFARSKMILCKNFKYLSKDGYQLKKFVKIPLYINKIGFCLQIETDTGVKTLLLDTGSSKSILHEASAEKELTVEFFQGVPVWRTNKLMIGSKDFGPQTFDLFEISPLLSEVDGILGMDFLRKHAVFFDRDQLAAYVEK
jgi:hypothetical protein